MRCNSRLAVFTVTFLLKLANGPFLGYKFVHSGMHIQIVSSFLLPIQELLMSYTARRKC